MRTGPGRRNGRWTSSPGERDGDVEEGPLAVVVGVRRVERVVLAADRDDRPGRQHLDTRDEVAAGVVDGRLRRPLAPGHAGDEDHRVREAARRIDHHGLVLDLRAANRLIGRHRDHPRLRRIRHRHAPGDGAGALPCTFLGGRWRGRRVEHAGDHRDKARDRADP